jgi:hypothetical protein
MGHDPVVPHGTAIEMIYKTNVCLYDELDPDASEHGMAMTDAGVGLVLDHTYHIDKLELARASRLLFNSRRVLSDVDEHLWYLVMFQKGHYWVRWNWLAVVTEPVEAPSATPGVESSRGQGAEPW